MKKILIGIFIIGIIMSTAIYYKQSQEVKELEYSEITDIEFEQMLAQKDLFYVYFYSPTCRECRDAEPKIIQAVEGKRVKLVKLNINEYKEAFNNFKSEHDINLPGVPAVLRFEDGKVTGGIVGSPEKVETYAEFFKVR